MASSLKIVRLKIELSDIDPAIWRRVEVPADFPLRRLHDVIQAVFDWLDYHLHRFEVGDRIYGAPEHEDGDFGGERLYSDKNIKLGALLDRGVQRFIYRYDFGDDWEHVITVEQVTDRNDGVDYPILVDGNRHAPALKPLDLVPERLSNSKAGARPDAAPAGRRSARARRRARPEDRRRSSSR